MNLYILQNYNNYYNRIIKKEDTLSDYLDNYDSFVIENVINFNPGDGITTTQVSNSTIIGDYAIYTEDDEIISRWFVIEAKRQRNGQFILTLRRDVIVDNYNDVLSAPLFVEKATLSVNDPMLLNSEDMTFNQIKTSETLLKDETNCPWVVGYIPRDWKPEKAITINYPLTNSADITVTNLSDWGYYNKLNEVNTGSLKSGTVGIYVYAINTLNMITAGFNLDGTRVNLNPDEISQQIGNIPTPDKNNLGLQFTTDFDDGMIYDFRNKIVNLTGSNLTDIISSIKTEEGIMGDGDFIAIQKLQGQIIHETSTDTYYKVNVEFNTSSNVTNCTNTELTAINSAINRNAVTNNPIIGTAKEGLTYKLEYTYNTYKITIEQSYSSATIDLSGERYHLTDQPYDMFCMPYSDDLEIYKNGYLQFKANKDLALSIGTSIAAAVGTDKVYDVQLLPYCPVRYCIKDGKFDVGSAFVEPIKQNLTTLGYIFWANSSNFTFNIYKDIKIKPDSTITQTYAETTNSIGWVSITNIYPYEKITHYEVTSSTIPVKSVSYNNRRKQFDVNFGIENKNIAVEFTLSYSIEKTPTNIDVKVVNECDTYRLCSPNYNGQFEFNLAKNGDISYFNIDCTYKPFNPYIHVNPNFGKLYGKDFNDARGLICSGDFSLPQISSAWANWQANNKNYEAIFNREIQNMEIKNNISRLQDVLNVPFGALGTGATVGLGTGNVGAGLISGALSGVAGIADVAINERLRQETMSYTKDMYGYKLGNIKAIPYSLSKVGALNNNNKLFPFIEYYTCTETEKTALKNKIKYNGMTVMRIGTISEFLQTEKTYIKGQLIRITNINDDYHMLQEINNELYRGVYI